MLMQETNYNEKQKELIRQIYVATQLLYKLNESLILLSRIENNQFVEVSEININLFITEKLVELEDFIEEKEINIIKHFNQNLILTTNAPLFNIFINNLLINSIKYTNDKNGTIEIILNSKSLAICNTSLFGELNKKEIYKRFNKKPNSNSLGLGLSIIKRIADFNGWEIAYSFKNKTHEFLIKF